MITGETRGGEEEEEEGTSGRIEEVMEVGVLAHPSGTSKVANSSYSSKTVLAKVLTRRRSHPHCHLVVRRSKAEGRVMPTVGKVGEEGSNRQNRGVLGSLMALVGLFRVGRIRRGNRPIMT